MRYSGLGTGGIMRPLRRNYDDMTATRRTQAEREEAYLRELQDLYQRHRELEQQKQPILDNLRRLYPPPPGAPKG
jgi:hypothetical protein